MDWYKHDTNSTQDAKIKKLLLRYGELGYAVYFHCLELIMADVNKDNLTFILEHDSEIIADNLKVKGTQDKSGIERVEDVMRYIIDLKLFNESNGIIQCLKLLNRMDTSMSSNSLFRQRVSDAKNRLIEGNLESCQRHDVVMQEKRREDEIREDEKREEGNSLSELISYGNKFFDVKESLSPTTYKDKAERLVEVYKKYGYEKLKSAIDNFVFCKNSSSHWVPGYQTAMNFISSGRLESFFVENDPYKAYSNDKPENKGDIFSTKNPPLKGI